MYARLKSKTDEKTFNNNNNISTRPKKKRPTPIKKKWTGVKMLKSFCTTKNLLNYFRLSENPLHIFILKSPTTTILFLISKYENGGGGVLCCIMKIFLLALSAWDKAISALSQAHIKSIKTPTKLWRALFYARYFPPSSLPPPYILSKNKRWIL